MRIFMEPIPADGRGHSYKWTLHHRRHTTKECWVPSALWSQTTRLVSGRRCTTESWKWPSTP